MCKGACAKKLIEKGVTLRFSKAQEGGKHSRARIISNSEYVGTLQSPVAVVLKKFFQSANHDEVKLNDVSFFSDVDGFVLCHDCSRVAGSRHSSSSHRHGSLVFGLALAF